MLKKQTIIPLIALMLFSAIALAQESPCSQNIPDGFTCIEGSLGWTIFSQEQLNSVLGGDSFEVKEGMGVVMLKYRIPGSRATKSLGYISGRVVQYKDPAALSVGNFIAGPDTQLHLNVTNNFYFKPKAHNDLSDIEFSSLVGNMRYTANNHTFLCRRVDTDSTAEQDKWARCIMTGVLKANPDSSCYSPQQDGSCFASYLNATFGVVAVPNFMLEKYIVQGSEMGENSITEVSNLRVREVAGADSLGISALQTAGDSSFGKLKFTSEEEVHLLHFLYEEESFYSITAHSAEVMHNPDANIVLFSKNTEENTGEIRANVNNHGLLRLSSGYMLMLRSEELYNLCSSENRAQISSEFREGWDLQSFVRSSSCSFIDEESGAINIQPRAYLFEENTYPLALTVSLPAEGGYSSLNIARFQVFGDRPSSVTLTKEGMAEKKLIFYETDLRMVGISSIFEYGISFVTSIKVGGIYQTLDCRLPLRACYLDEELWYRESGSELRGNRYLASRNGLQCNTDADCGEGSQTCISQKCVTKMTCSVVEGFSGAGTSANKLDIVFVEDTSSEFGGAWAPGEFDYWVQNIIDKNGNNGFRGIFSLAPYKDYKRKFAFWTVKARMPVSDPGQNPALALMALNSAKKHCAAADTAILLVPRPILRPFADSATKVSVTGKNYLAEQRPSPDTGALERNVLPIMHEIGHSIGDARDEYLRESSADGNFNHPGSPNCLTLEDATRQWGRSLANRAWGTEDINWRGCGGDCSVPSGECEKVKEIYIRPVENSLMADPRLPGGGKYSQPAEKQIADKLRAYS